jgi:hypothetical protein
MYNYFLYIIRRPETSGDVRRYIGVSHFSKRNNPRRRFSNHKAANSYVGSFIRKYSDSSIYILVQDLNYNEAYKLEKELVPDDSKQRKILHLLNETGGGDHPPKFSDLKTETQEKISKQRSETLKEKYKDAGYKENLIKKRLKTFSLISPDGVIYTGIGIFDFCKQMDLDSTCIGRLMDNERMQHKGWKKYHNCEQ